MNFIKKIISMLQSFKLKREWTKRSNVKFGTFCSINEETIFEGHNVLGSSTEFKSSIMGFGSYIADGTKINGSCIGKFCSVGKNVSIAVGDHPSRNFVSSHPSFFSVNNVTNFSYVEEDKFIDIKKIKKKGEDKPYNVIIGNDVWIGNNVLILGGVIIGDGAIIGAGSVVTKNVEDYAIVAGSPAKKIRMRFSPDDIMWLEELKWWDKDSHWLNENAKYFSDVKLLRKILEG